MEIFTSDIKDKFKKYTTHVDISTFSLSIHISLQHGYMYTDTPKVCSTTIMNSLHRLELDNPEYSVNNGSDLHDRLRSPLLLPCQVGDFEKLLADKSFFKFCFSRNPYTRLLSAYLDKVKPGTFQNQGLVDFLDSAKYSNETQFSFDEFVNIVFEQPLNLMNMHWRPQYYQTYQDNIKYDFIGKMENFREDFKVVFEHVNCDYNRFVASERAHATNANDLIEQYYTPHLLKLVEQKFAKDFDFFGYDNSLSTSRKEPSIA